MKEYHKIKNIYKRNKNTKKLIEGYWATPEFEYLKDNTWVGTEKVDGMNLRVGYANGIVGFGGKTDRAQIPGPLQVKLYEKFAEQIQVLDSLFNGQEVCFYGEGYGPKIQSGGKYREDQDIVLFDIRIGHWWLKREDVLGIAKKLGLDVIPVILVNTLGKLIDLVKSGFTSEWGDFQAEGIVAKPAVELKARSGDRIIAKIKTKDFS